MKSVTETKKVWLGEIAPGGGTYPDCINKLFKVTGKIPKNTFIDLLTNELRFATETFEKE